MNSLFRVHDRQHRATGWIAADLGDDGLFVYYAKNKCFKRLDAVETDYYFDQELTYEPITAQQAVEDIRGGAGRIDARRDPDLVPELDTATESDRRTLLQVIPEVRAMPISTRRAAHIQGNAFAQKAPGEAMPWRSYSAERRASAYALASKIRHGHIKALPAGTEAHVTSDEAGTFTVMITKPSTTSAPATDVVARAKAIAEQYHQGQQDKAGHPYVTHPARVARRVTGDPTLEAIAWLHDVVEDTDATTDTLAAAGIPAEVITGVEAITHRPGELRDTYYARFAANPHALAVKRADIADNSDPDRLAQLPADTAQRLRVKYRNAAKKLDTYLAS